MSRSKRAIAESPCRRCRRKREYFYYRRDTYKFDVDMAWSFIKKGRKPVEVADESVRVAVDRCEIDPEHVTHVNTKYPGLIAHVRYFDDEDPEVVKGHLLIDGHHRAARCLQEGTPFFAYLLTEEESAAIVVRAPYLSVGPASPEAAALKTVAPKAAVKKVCRRAPRARKRVLVAS